jgi:hypothetical protein
MMGYLITLAMIGIIVGSTEKRSEVVGLRVYSLMATANGPDLGDRGRRDDAFAGCGEPA